MFFNSPNQQASFDSDGESLIPQTLPPFYKRALFKIIGLSIIGSVVLLAVALSSWSPEDPSFTHARTGFSHNWLGVIGATVADLMMQFLGLSSLALLVPPFFWGVSYLYHKKSRYGTICILAWINAICLAAIGASAARPSANWPLPKGMGGLLGDSLFGRLQVFLDIAPVSVDSALLGVSCAVMGIIFCAIAAGYGLPYICLDAEPFYKAQRLKAVRSSRLKSRENPVDMRYEKNGALISLGISFASFSKKMLSRSMEFLRLRKTNIPLPSEPPEGVLPPEPLKGSDENALKVMRLEPSLVPSKSSSAPQTRKRLSLWKKDVNASDVKRTHYSLPPVDFLQNSFSESCVHDEPYDLNEGKAQLESVLSDFGIRGVIRSIRPGPVVTLYELEPAPGTKSSRVISLADDIARSLSAISARVAVIPGRNAIGIELPNPKRKVVYLRELLESQEFVGTRFKLPLCLGKAIGGEPVVVELAQMPHLLVAGTTGSGKSVAINTMILSLLYRLTPEECRMIMIDPKMLELSVYEGIPHLLTPVVTDPKQAVIALKWVVREMEERYKKMSKLGVRNIVGFNARVQEAKAAGDVLRRRVQTGFDHQTGQATYEDEEMDLEVLPYIVVIVDEMADLMIVAGKEIEGHIQRLAQMARASGIHVVLATQRPSVDVITGTIKANFPTRISFQVSSRIDSRTILGEMGAEQLLGQGDMLYMAVGGRITRVHGPFVSDLEVEQVVVSLKTQGSPQYVESLLLDPDEDEGSEGKERMYGQEGEGSKSDLYDQAVACVLRDKRASTSYIQRRLQIGYNRAASLMERMEKENIVSPPNHAGKRTILLSSSETEDF
jgi:S-DNA-T family DNA segregation ATPase FtsK/SpoIIIE